MWQMKLLQLQVNMEKQNCFGKSIDMFKNCKMFVNYAKKVKEMQTAEYPQSRSDHC